MKKWRFIPNQNSTIVGINDAGIETFTANMHRSLVRESIQNSLDAIVDGYHGPVEVEFSLFDVQTNNLPDYEGLHQAIKLCASSNKDEQDAFEFFDAADNVLASSSTSVLRISDYHTKGLEGSDTCAKGTSWSRLVKESGSSNKGQDSGGSFGIGKSAAFACSDLRTVFYSSLDCKGLISNIGVAKLVSFNDFSLGWTTGVGYYSEDNKFVAIPQLAEFDSSYSRKTSGTDIYILGMHKSSEMKDAFIRAVLLDFLVSIVTNRLVVRIQGEEINQSTINKYMEKLCLEDTEEVRNLKEYYYLLTSNDPSVKKIKLDSKVYGSKYGFQDGECTLYLKEGESLNRRILITRKAGMRIFEQTHISGVIEFTGVLVIDGVHMNEAFKKMEVPSHDAWEPGRIRNNSGYYKEIYDNLRKYLRETVRDLFGSTNDTVIDAFGANDFLPDNINDITHQGKVDDKPTSTIAKIIGTTHIPGNTSPSDPSLDPVPPQPTPGPGPNPDKYKEFKVKKRLTCIDAYAGKYVLSFNVPNDSMDSKLKFAVSGEQANFSLPIKSAKIILGSGKTSVTEIVDDTIFFEKMVKGDFVKLEVVVDFDNYCMMEVNYYEAKK